MLNNDATAKVYGEGKKLGGVAGRWFSGHFQGGDRKMLFSQNVKINHGCCPNITERRLGREDLDRADMFSVIRANRDIEVGEEILRSYVDPMRPKAERLAKLGFECRYTLEPTGTTKI